MGFKHDNLSVAHWSSNMIAEARGELLHDVLSRQAPPPVTKRPIRQDVAKTRTKAEAAGVPNTVNPSQVVVICLGSHFDFLRRMARETENPK